MFSYMVLFRDPELSWLLWSNTPLIQSLFCHCQIAQLDSRARFPVCLAGAIALQCLLAWLRKIPGGLGLVWGFFLLSFFFPLAFAYLSKLRCSEDMVWF